MGWETARKANIRFSYDSKKRTYLLEHEEISTKYS